MLGYIDKIRQISKGLLENKKVDIIIGFKKGTMPMMNEPCLIKSPKDVEKLVWDSPLAALRRPSWGGIGNYKFLSVLLLVIMAVLYILFQRI